MEGNLNLDGKLLKLTITYNSTKILLENMKDDLSSIRDKMIQLMKEENINKAKSQLYSVSLSVVKPKPKPSTKKLKEELLARGLNEIWEDCLYTPKPYDKLLVSSRKSGESIF